MPDDFWFGYFCFKLTITIPSIAISKLIQSCVDNVSPRKIIESRAICTSMELLIMPDSTTLSICSDLFQSVKAKVVLMDAS